MPPKSAARPEVWPVTTDWTITGVGKKGNAHLGGPERPMRAFGSSGHHTVDEEGGVLPWAQELAFPERKGKASEEG